MICGAVSNRRPPASSVMTTRSVIRRPSTRVRVVRTSEAVVEVTCPAASIASVTTCVCFQLPAAKRPQTSSSRGVGASSVWARVLPAAAAQTQAAAQTHKQSRRQVAIAIPAATKIDRPPCLLSYPTGQWWIAVNGKNAAGKILANRAESGQDEPPIVVGLAVKACEVVKIGTGTSRQPNSIIDAAL